MAGWVTSLSGRERDVVDTTLLSLVSRGASGLSEQLSGRIDGHVQAFGENIRQGLLAASTAIGLEVVTELMGAEVVEIFGQRGRHDPDRTAKRQGTESSTVNLGGRRVTVRRPRVRTVSSDDEPEREVALEAYQTFASTDLLTEGILARMLTGISTRRYTAALEPVGETVAAQSHGTSKSVVARPGSPSPPT